MCARASAPGSAQEPPCDRPCPAEIDDADMALAKHRHDLADVSHARCSGLGEAALAAASVSPSSNCRGRKLSMTAISSRSC